MNDLKLDSNNDLFVGTDLELTTDDENVIQELKIRLQFFKGEWFLDVLAGIPYIDEILKKQVDLDDIKAIFIREITISDGVDELLSFNLSYKDRGLRVEFSVKAENRTISDTIDIRI